MLAEEESREKAAEADKVLKDTLSATDQAIQQVLTSLTENIAEKVRQLCGGGGECACEVLGVSVWGWK